jgi:hypothetical protein
MDRRLADDDCSVQRRALLLQLRLDDLLGVVPGAAALAMKMVWAGSGSFGSVDANGTSASFGIEVNGARLTAKQRFQVK